MSSTQSQHGHSVASTALVPYVPSPRSQVGLIWRRWPAATLLVAFMASFVVAALVFHVTTDKSKSNPAQESAVPSAVAAFRPPPAMLESQAIAVVVGPRAGQGWQAASTQSNPYCVSLLEDAPDAGALRLASRQAGTFPLTSSGRSAESGGGPAPPIPSPPVRMNAPTPSRVHLDAENIAHLQQKLNEAIRRAERGALYSARSLMIENLRDISVLLDAKAGGQPHSTALAQALRAIDEADDFEFQGMQFETDLEIRGFIDGHDTPILKGHGEMSPVTAREAYYAFARDQLVLASGREQIAGQTYVCARPGRGSVAGGRAVRSERRSAGNSLLRGLADDQLTRRHHGQ